MRVRWLSPAPLGEIGLLLIFALLYAATLDNGLQPYELHGGDLITHQYAQVQARPSNAPGYPLYTMGGWLWFHSLRRLLSLFQDLPNPIPILSSYSTLWALLALWLFQRIIRLLSHSPAQPHGNWTLAWLLTSFFGVTYFFWYYATTTEQYSSAIAHTLAILYIYLHWRAAPARLGLLYLLAFLSGLALAHMLTVALIVPGLVAVVLHQSPGLLRRPRVILTTVVAALLPLASYSYVYLRGVYHPEWWGAGDWSSPQAWFWAFVSTAQGRQELLWAFEPGRPFLGNGFPDLVWQELSLPLLLLGLLGIGRLDRRLATLLYTTLLFYLVFCWAYRFGNWFQVVLPAYPLILLGLVPLVGDWQQSAAVRRSRWQRRVWSALPALLLIAALVWRVDQSLPRADSRNRPEDTGLDRAARLLAQPLPTGAGLFAPVDDALALAYLTQIWQFRPDAQVVSSRAAANLLATARPLLATWEAVPTLLGELPNGASLAVQGVTADWVQIGAHSSTPAASADPHFTPIDFAVTPDLRLAGYSAAPAPDEPVTGDDASGLDVILQWQLASGVWPSGLAISVRPLATGSPLMAPDGRPIQQDRPRPVYGLWHDDPARGPSTIVDGYYLPHASGADELLVILYTTSAGGFDNLAEIRLPLEGTNPPAPPNSKTGHP